MALIVVDVQNDFADPEGSLAVAGGAEAIPFINDEIRRAAAAGALVVYTQDWHPATTPHFAKDGGIWPVHCVAGTRGADFHPDLIVVGDSVKKGANGEDGYSGFTMRDPVSGKQKPTEMAAMLRAHDVSVVAVVGLATDYCVKSTALDAAASGYVTRVLADGIRAVNLSPGDGARAVAEMAAAGVIVE